MSNRRVLSCAGGHLVLPLPGLALVGARDGGNLIVNPPRPVWERSELTRDELVLWSLLIAACGRAMLDELPQLDGGCINYWEAGNWALNEKAPPAGPKNPRVHRSVHLHLLGRSRTSTDPAWRWGEGPVFPDYHSRFEAGATCDRLNAEEVTRVVARAGMLLTERYGYGTAQILPSSPCPVCRYPTPRDSARTDVPCAECAVNDNPREME